jgi:hypothetical protein
LEAFVVDSRRWLGTSESVLGKQQRAELWQWIDAMQGRSDVLPLMASPSVVSDRLHTDEDWKNHREGWWLSAHDEAASLIERWSRKNNATTPLTIVSGDIHHAAVLHNRLARVVEAVASPLFSMPLSVGTTPDNNDDNDNDDSTTIAFVGGGAHYVGVLDLETDAAGALSRATVRLFAARPWLLQAEPELAFEFDLLDE